MKNAEIDAHTVLAVFSTLVHAAEKMDSTVEMIVFHPLTSVVHQEVKNAAMAVHAILSAAVIAVQAALSADSTADMSVLNPVTIPFHTLVK